MAEIILDKMHVEFTQKSNNLTLNYFIKAKPQPLPITIGQNLFIKFLNKCYCTLCERPLRKPSPSGYCYPCFSKRAEADLCVLNPHTCHHFLGTCRDNEFAKRHCFVKHLVYLADSNGVKVGLTRLEQKWTRWVDQGANQAIELAIVENRKLAGDIEKFISAKVKTQTNVRKMLAPATGFCDLKSLRQEIVASLNSFTSEISTEEPFKLHYDVLAFPPKYKSYKLVTTPSLGGKLMGIKGQYLIFAEGVFNMRSHSGFAVDLTLQDQIHRPS